jgi:fimbrial chaperone protein
VAAAGAFAAGLAVLLAAGAAQAQSLTVLPVNIELPPGQLATTLTVLNQGAAETSVQVRALAWSQPNGVEQLVASDEVLISPPIVTIAAAASQVVRLVLRHAPRGHEATYRVLLDQIPPAAAAGTVRVALRLSIPVFAEPATRALAHLQYHVESDAGQLYLVALNDGGRHDTLRGIALTTSAGAAVKTAPSASPYVLAGATARWRIDTGGAAPATGETFHLVALADTGAVNQSVAVVAHP